ncbi:hypothetical protein BDQ17DRAFT_1511572 [Cyathus striatus]|nr:hypothetical protein BDQ17DRAFT_1511572 [Cyathus striatus]
MSHIATGWHIQAMECVKQGTCNIHRSGLGGTSFVWFSNRDLLLCPASRLWFPASFRHCTTQEHFHQSCYNLNTGMNEFTDDFVNWALQQRAALLPLASCHLGFGKAPQLVNGLDKSMKATCRHVYINIPSLVPKPSIFKFQLVSTGPLPSPPPNFHTSIQVSCISIKNMFWNMEDSDGVKTHVSILLEPDFVPSIIDQESQGLSKS